MEEDASEGRSRDAHRDGLLEEISEGTVQGLRGRTDDATERLQGKPREKGATREHFRLGIRNLLS